MVKLPAQALTQLAEIRAGLVAPGEIFWLPTSLIMFYDSDRDERPCLVVGVDRARAHLVPGTTKRRGGCCVVVQPGETGLPKRTYFDFSFSFSLALLNLVNSGHPKVLSTLAAGRTWSRPSIPRSRLHSSAWFRDDRHLAAPPR